MGFIDKKLYDLGYTIQEFGDHYVTYAKKMYDFDDEKGKIENGYCHVVEIRARFSSKLNVYPVMSSHMMGESCSWGNHHCALPLSLSEMRWIIFKMLYLNVVWNVRGKIRRLFK